MIKKMTAGTFGLTESVIKNDSSERLVLEAGEAIEFTDPETKYCKITFRGTLHLRHTAALLRTDPGKRIE